MLPSRYQCQSHHNSLLLPSGIGDQAKTHVTRPSVGTAIWGSIVFAGLP